MVNCAGSTDFQVLTIKSPFGEKILVQISPYFGHYSSLFKFVVSFHKGEYPMRSFFRNNDLHC